MTTLGSLWGGGQGRRGGQRAPRSDSPAGMDAARSIRLAPVRLVTPSLSFFQGQGPRITQHGQREAGRGRGPGASELKPRFTGSTLSTTVRDGTAGLDSSRVLSPLPHCMPGYGNPGGGGGPSMGHDERPSRSGPRLPGDPGSRAAAASDSEAPGRADELAASGSALPRGFRGRGTDTARRQQGRRRALTSLRVMMLGCWP